MISSLQSLQTHFAKIDKSGDGLLCKAELVAGLEQAGLNLSYDQIESVWRIVDEDKVTLDNCAEHLVMCTYVQSGEIEYQEFIAVFIGEMAEERVFFVNKCWRKLDPKGSGEVNKFDAQNVFR